MTKSAAIFLLAVLAPSVVLGWLALRSAQEQQIILERRTAELYQTEADRLAANARAIVDDQRRGFEEAVRKLIAERTPDRLAREFASALAGAWPRKAVGFAIGRDGRILSPTAQDAAAHAEWKSFLWDNGQFLSDKMDVVAFPVAVEELNRPYDNRKKADVANGSRSSQEMAKLESPASFAQNQSAEPSLAKESRAVVMKQQSPSAPLQKAETQAPSQQAMTRNVAPQQVLALSERASQLTWAVTNFGGFTLQGKEGILARFVQDRLELILWLRPEQDSSVVFGCMLEADSLKDLWPEALSRPEQRDSGSWGRDNGRDQPEFILALLDDKARPVAAAPADSSSRDWKRPFVASEIGEALPHWEAALYLTHPEQIPASARGLRRTLAFLIAISLGIIACGGWLVVADTRRQMALAQKKTDFVSNVSHELKTPLTSIRMFAELMLSGRSDPGRSAQYLRIIMVESERLTRLINNVLDFARIERKQKVLERAHFDLHPVIERTWENQALHLRESGFTAQWQAAPGPYPVLGDEDAIAQILVNLLSNAEKYSGAQKEVELQSYIDGASICVSVLDRGAGVPEGEEAKIFEAFYRAHDSLSSGIQGSGLGLTLAQRHAREQGGEILCQSRPGGGSIFTLRLPLAAPATPVIP